jgi:rSAM/selenodomain-associated transferase 2
VTRRRGKSGFLVKREGCRQDASFEVTTTAVSLSIIIPCLDEARVIGRTLQSVAASRARGAEVIVVDGGSRDDTAAIARAGADRVTVAQKGRASQMNAGAAIASGEVLLFLHADSRPPPDFDRAIVDGLRTTQREWGRFDVRIEGRHPMLWLVSFLMNLRSRVTGIATGDQGLFVERALFTQLGGFPEMPLMEDIAFTRMLRRRGPPLCLRECVTTSGRRWDERGFLTTVVLMWRLRFDYWRGADPGDLARRYGR